MTDAPEGWEIDSVRPFADRVRLLTDLKSPRQTHPVREEAVHCQSPIPSGAACYPRRNTLPSAGDRRADGSVWDTEGMPTSSGLNTTGTILQQKNALQKNEFHEQPPGVCCFLVYGLFSDWCASGADC